MTKKMYSKPKGPGEVSLIFGIGNSALRGCNSYLAPDEQIELNKKE
jgi:hypothetical protein